MAKFKLIGVVDRTVTDTISLTVEADNEGDAYTKARAVLARYPEEHQVSGVPFAYVDAREWHEPELRDLREQVKEPIYSA